MIDENVKKLCPKNRRYIACNFETIADCPNCGHGVIDSIGYRETTCSKCGQMLDWEQRR